MTTPTATGTNPLASPPAGVPGTNPNPGSPGPQDQGSAGQSYEDLGSEAGEGTPAVETEEVEHEGRKYLIPKPLKPALMFHADYTRKTQEAAERERQKDAELAAREQQFQLRAQAQLQLVGEYARVASLDQQLEPYARVNWTQAMAQDSVSAQAAWMQFQQLKEQRAAAVSRLQSLEAQQIAQQQQAIRQRLEEGMRRLPKEIQGWGPELRDRVKETVMNAYGFTEGEMAQVFDARLVRLMHDAHQFHALMRQAQSKQQASSSAAGGAEAPGAAAGLPNMGMQPPPTLPAGGSGSTRSVTDPNISTSEFMRRRQEQLNKRRNGSPLRR